MVKNKLLLILASLMLTGCFKDSPEYYDGDMSIELTVVYDNDAVIATGVTIKTIDYEMDTVCDTTDSSGFVSFTGLPWATYQATVRSSGIVPSFLDSTDYDTLLVVGTMKLMPGPNGIIKETLYVESSGTQPGLKINEIYSVGPPNNFYYFFDQYIELYNSSEDTIYLDGMVICRMGQFLAHIVYIFQFPGTPLTGQEYPIGSGEFKVIAGDAFDHRTIVPASIDLSQADFEFRNSMDYGDYDNLDVPNLDNIEVGHRLDFMISLSSDVILIADGSDLNYLDGMDIDAVIDCVEYSSNSTHEKDIETELDRSFAGIGQVKYSGSSIERIAPGFDSNSSAEDFEIIAAPTIGYQHESN